MSKRIALFNHKGGVSKTTTTFNLGWMLASKGKRVIIVDADPQCNLTGLVLGYKDLNEFDDFFQREPGRNIKAGLAPAFESRPTEIQPVDCVPVGGVSNLYLLPGHIGLSEYEVTLGIAQELSGSIQTLQNLPGSLSFLLDRTAASLEADYVLIDMNPSLSSINQNLLMTSHYFLVPTSPDYFSVMAINSLAGVLPRWRAWAKSAQESSILREATYAFPSIDPMFLGTIIQNFRPRGGAPAAAFGKWVDEIKRTVAETLSPALDKVGMMLPREVYEAAGLGTDECLATIPDFNSLIAKSQENRTPVFALSKEQIGQSGVVLGATVESRDQFRALFSDLGDKVLRLADG